MDKKKMASALVLIAIALLGLFWFSPWNQKANPVSLKEQKEHSHDGDGEHSHNEEGVVELSNKQLKNLEIGVKTAEPGTLSISLSTRGKIILHPDRLVHVLPNVSGVALEARKKIGDTVKSGEVVAILESREMADLKANYLAALEKEKLSNSLFDREDKLHQNKVSAEQDFINARSALEETKINLELAKQKLKAFGLSDEEIDNLNKQNAPDLRLLEIRSPMDGVVIARHITKGEYIENNATIYEIGDLSDVWVEIGVYPKDLSKITIGQIVKISVPFENLSSEAKIIYVSPIIAEETITSKAIADLDNRDKKWRPGTFVTVDVATDKINAPIVISKEAIQNIDGSDVVFVKIHDGFEKRAIQIGRSDDKNVEVLSGLKKGEEYAASNTFLLKAELGKSAAEHTH